VPDVRHSKAPASTLEAVDLVLYHGSEYRDHIVYLAYMAIVQPESVVANMSVDSIMQEVDDGAITTRYFDDRQAATEWLADRRTPV